MIEYNESDNNDYEWRLTEYFLQNIIVDLSILKSILFCEVFEDDFVVKNLLFLFQNNVERAVDWIFSHPDDLGGDDDEPAAASDTDATQSGTNPELFPFYNVNNNSSF